MTSDSYIEEDRIQQALDRRFAVRLFAYIRPYWRWMVLSSVISLGMALLELAGPLIIRKTIDEHIVQADYRGIALLSGLFILTVLGRFVCEYLLNYLIAYVGQQGMYNLRSAIFAHVQKLSVSFFDRTPVGRLMTRITSDVQALNELFSQGAMTLAGDLFLLVTIVCIMLYTNVKLSLLIFATMPFLAFASWLFRKKVRASFRDVRARLSRMNAYLQENLSGIRTVQAYNREARNLEQFMALNAHYNEANVRTVFYHAVFFPAVEVIASVALASIVWYGGASALRGTITIGTIYLFIQYMHLFYQPIRELSEKFNIFQTALASAERIFRLLDTPVDIASPPQPVRFAGLEREIRFENVWFAYKDEEWVLRDVSFEVRHGETVALVGATGSGKTTIINLLARFYDVKKGAIRMDGIDIRDMDLEELRRQVAVVLQDVFLFAGDIASNIRLGNEGISDEQLHRCAEFVNADRFISRLPGTYASEVRERGATLSVGQKQLLAFARALAFDPRILILDEATASIDTETELLIQDALRKLLRGRTSIVIAHRLSTIQNADKIIVLHKGKIRETGTHAQLLQQNGIYRKLYELQYREDSRGAALQQA